MPKKNFLFVILMAVILLSGCETAKGVGVGIGTTLGGTVEGVAKDSTNLWQALQKTDKWIRENLW